MAAVCCVGVSFDFAMVVLSCGGGDGGVCLDTSINTVMCYNPDVQLTQKVSIKIRNLFEHAAETPEEGNVLLQLHGQPALLSKKNSVEMSLLTPQRIFQRDDVKATQQLLLLALLLHSLST